MEGRSFQDVRRTSRLIAGALLIAVGVIFVLANLGMFRPPRLAEWWPLVLVWLGLSRLAASRFASGAVLLALGIVLQLDRFGFDVGSLTDLWPLLLIAAGIGLITDSFLARAGSRRDLHAASDGELR